MAQLQSKTRDTESKWFHWENSVTTWGTVCGLVIFISLYYRCLWIQPAGDDWLLLTPVRQAIQEYGFWGALPRVFRITHGDFYRPLAILPLVFALHQVFWIQFAKIVFLTGYGVLVYRTAMELVRTRPWAAAITLMTILHQTYILVFAEIDFGGDLICDVVYLLLLLWSYRYWTQNLTLRQFLPRVIVATMIGLFAKEAAVGAFLVPSAFAVMHASQNTELRRRGFVTAAACVLGLSCLYMLVRSMAGMSVSGPSDGYYSFHFGMNIFTNMGLAVISLFSPVNTVAVMLDGKFWTGLALIWVLLFIAVCLWGLWINFKMRTLRYPMLLWLIFLGILGPVLLMPHLSEANVSRSIVIGWIAFAISVRPVFRPGHRIIIRSLTSAIFVLWLAFDISAVNSRLDELMATHARLAGFRENIRTIMPGAPAKPIRFAVIDPGYRGYSLYRNPLAVDLPAEIPSALRDMYKSPALDASFVVVKGVQEAEATTADFIVFDDGKVIPRNPR